MKQKIAMTIDEYIQFHKDLVKCLHDLRANPMPTRRSIVVYIKDDGRYGTTVATFNDDFTDFDRVEEAGGIVVAEFSRMYEDEVDLVIDSWKRAEQITGFSTDELCRLVANTSWEEYKDHKSAQMKFESEISLGDVIEYIRKDDDLAFRCRKEWLKIAISEGSMRGYLYEAHKIADGFVAKHMEMLEYLLINGEWEELDYDEAVNEYCRLNDTKHHDFTSSYPAEQLSALHYIDTDSVIKEGENDND